MHITWEKYVQWRWVTLWPWWSYVENGTFSQIHQPFIYSLSFGWFDYGKWKKKRVREKKIFVCMNIAITHSSCMEHTKPIRMMNLNIRVVNRNQWHYTTRGIMRHTSTDNCMESKKCVDQTLYESSIFLFIFEAIHTHTLTYQTDRV